jgi:hypothetical protein
MQLCKLLLYALFLHQLHILKVSSFYKSPFLPFSQSFSSSFERKAISENAFTFSHKIDTSDNRPLFYIENDTLIFDPFGSQGANSSFFPPMKATQIPKNIQEYISEHFETEEEIKNLKRKVKLWEEEKWDEEVRNTIIIYSI